MVAPALAGRPEPNWRRLWRHLWGTTSADTEGGYRSVSFLPATCRCFSCCSGDRGYYGQQFGVFFFDFFWFFFLLPASFSSGCLVHFPGPVERDAMPEAYQLECASSSAVAWGS